MRGLSDIEVALSIFKDGAYLWKYQNCDDLFALLECENCGRREAIFTGCGLRICPKCAKRRGKKLFKRYVRIFTELLEKLRCRLSLLTLTVRNRDDLASAVYDLIEGWKKFRRRAYFRNRVYGGVFALEVKKGEKGWNVHAHILLLHEWFGVPKLEEVKHLVIPERLSETKGIRSWKDLLKPRKGLGQIVLSVIWENITGDPVIDIRSARSPKGALRYLVKYILKPPEFEKPEDYVAFLEALWKKPMLKPFGCVLDFKEERVRFICLLCLSPMRFVCVCLSWEVKELCKPPPSSEGIAGFANGG